MHWPALSPFEVNLHHYDTDPMYVKVLVENLDAGVAVTDVEVIATVGG